MPFSPLLKDYDGSGGKTTFHKDPPKFKKCKATTIFISMMIPICITGGCVYHNMAYLPYLVPVFGGGSSMTGFISALPCLMQVLTTPAINNGLKRFRPTTMMKSSLFMCCVGAAIVAAAPWLPVDCGLFFPVYCLGVAINGFSFTLAFNHIYTIMPLLFDEADMGFPANVCSVLPMASGAFCQWFSVTVLTYFGGSGPLAWCMPPLCYSGAGLLYGLWFQWYCPALWVGGEEEVDASSNIFKEFPVKIIIPFIVLLWSMIANYFPVAFFPIMLMDEPLNLSMDGVGLVYSLQMLLCIPFMLPIAKWDARYESKYAFALVSFTCLCITYAYAACVFDDPMMQNLQPWAPGPVYVVVWAVLGGVGTFSSTVAFGMLYRYLDKVEMEKRAAFAAALTNWFWGGAGVAGPVLGGILYANFGKQMLIAMFIGTSVICGPLTIFLINNPTWFEDQDCFNEEQRDKCCTDRDGNCAPFTNKDKEDCFHDKGKHGVFSDSCGLCVCCD